MEISVVIPSYKPQSYLFECLESIHAQSIDTDMYEVLIVLNGCKEPYYSDINNYISTKQNFRLLQTDIPGVSYARNLALSMIKGEYVAFVDDDDILSPNYFESLHRFAKRDRIVVSNVFAFHSFINEKRRDYLTFEHVNNGIFLNRCYLSTVWCKLIPVNIIRGRLFNVNFKIGEDALFMFSISDRIEYIILSNEDCIYYRRLRKNSASRSKITLKDRMKNNLRLQIAYTRIYFSGIYRYNLFLYLSRLLAVFK